MTDTGKLYWSAIKTFGVDLQLAVAIEEMAELTKELCKAQRTIFAARTGLGDGRIDNLDEIAEEIADVQIVLEELEQLYGAKKKVQKIRQQKLARLEMRIEKAREERGDNREHTAKWEDPGQTQKERAVRGGTAQNAGHQIANGTLRQTYAHAKHADTRTDR